MEEKKSKKTFINIFIILVILCVGIYLYARYVEPSLLIHNEYRISNEKLPESFDGIKIIHLTDLYYGNTTFKEELTSLVNDINLLKPDIVIFTGNLLSNQKKFTEKEMTFISSKLNEIEVAIGKYAVKGDSDYIKYYDKIMENTDFILLNNSSELIYNKGLTPIQLVGISSYLKNDADLVSLGFRNSYYTVVITHESDIIEDILVDYPNTDIILSGNTLGGLINLPFYGETVYQEGSKKYFSPYLKRNDTEIYISNGIGTNKYLYRFNNIPSYNLYRLKHIQ